MGRALCVERQDRVEERLYYKSVALYQREHVSSLKPRITKGKVACREMLNQTATDIIN
jgi:hypothetical protein